MATLGSQSRKIKITTPASLVGSVLTDFPTLVTAASLSQADDEIFDADGLNPANADGGDIRFSLDEAGTVLLAREIVEFTRDNTPANGTCEIYVKVPTLSSSVDTDIWCWYSDSGASEPASDDTHGSENVWTDYESVYHMGESDPSAEGPQDSTTNANHMTYRNAMVAGDSVGGILGGNASKGAVEFSGASSQGAKVAVSFPNEPMTFSAWYTPSTSFNNTIMALSRANNNSNYMHFLQWSSSSSLVGRSRRFSNGDATINPQNSNGVPGFHAFRLASDTSRFVHDNNQAEVENTVSQAVSFVDQLTIAFRGIGTGFGTGIYDEVRWALTDLGEAVLDANFENGNAPGTFANGGSPEDGVSGAVGNPSYYYQQLATVA